MVFSWTIVRWVVGHLTGWKLVNLYTSIHFWDNSTLQTVEDGGSRNVKNVAIPILFHFIFCFPFFFFFFILSLSAIINFQLAALTKAKYVFLFYSTCTSAWTSCLSAAGAKRDMRKRSITSHVVYRVQLMIFVIIPNVESLLHQERPAYFGSTEEA